MNHIKTYWRLLLMFLAEAVCWLIPGWEVYDEYYSNEGIVFVGITNGSYPERTLKLIIRISGDPWMFDREGNYDYPDFVEPK